MSNPADDELLYFAALAHGDKTLTNSGATWTRIIGYNDDLGCSVSVIWNPLLYPADAFDLLTRLQMDISYRSLNVDVTRGNICASEYLPTYERKIGRAECRAITRVAARIGKSLGGSNNESTY